MGKASTSKKVARAARAGGGRPGSQRSLVWPSIITALVLVGIALVVTSRGSNRADAGVRPLPFDDHWHAAYGIDNCGTFLPALTDISTKDPLGLHTHGDGLMHIHPFSSAASGKNANIGNWGKQTGLKVSVTTLEVSGIKLKNGDKCNGKPGKVVLKVWADLNDQTGHIVEGNPAKYAPQDGELLTSAFVAEGDDIPRPPSAANMTDPNAAEEGRTPVSVPSPSDGVTTTTAPAETSSTTATSAP
jgi:hypothetical protein